MNKVTRFFKKMFRSKSGVIIDLNNPDEDETELVEEDNIDDLAKEVLIKNKSFIKRLFSKSPKKKKKKTEIDLIEIKIGDYGFKRYQFNSKVGQYGIIVFRDDAKKMVLGRSVQLKQYLASISAKTVKEGRYGREIQRMNKIEIYYHEVDDKGLVSKTFAKINKHI